MLPLRGASPKGGDAEIHGIATPVCALARNDVFFLATPNYNLPYKLRQAQGQSMGQEQLDSIGDQIGKHALGQGR